MKRHALCKLLYCFLGKHLKSLNTINKLFELDDLLVDKRKQKRQILMSINCHQLSTTSIILFELREMKRLPVDQLSRSIVLTLIPDTSLKYYYHHLAIYFLQIYQSEFSGHGSDDRRLMHFKEFNIFDEERYELILVLNAVERCYFQELIKFLFRSRQFNTQLFN